jgi:transposase InsO family protein
MATGSFGFPKLAADGSNFVAWKMQAQSVLTVQDLWDVTQLKTSDDDKTVKIDQRALSTIRLMVTESVLIDLRHCNTARQAWLHLESKFEDRSLITRSLLRRKLTRLSWNGTSPIDEFLDTFQLTVDGIQATGETIEESFLCEVLLDALPESLQVFSYCLRMQKESLKLDILKTQLRQEALRRQVHSESNTTALFTKGRPPNKKKDKKDDKCNYCGKLGHWERECRRKMAESGKGQPPRNLNPKKFNIARENIQMLLTQSTEKGSLWIVDSGASHHATNNKNLLENYQTIEPQSIQVANNATLDAIGIGEVRGFTFSGTEVMINNVLYVPRLCNNLFSVSAATKFGCSINMLSTDCKINSSSGNEIILAAKKGNLYTFKLKHPQNNHFNVAKVQETQQIWHDRMGHLNIQSLQKLRSMAKGIDFQSEQTDVCETCLCAKQSRHPFPASKSRAKHVGELTHIDVWGPADIISRGGARYFLIIVDDCSRFATVHTLKNRGEVADKVIHYLNYVETQTGRAPKILRSDNAQEIIAGKLLKEVQRRGIKHQTTVPYTPQQNGIAERMNRTVVEMMRCILLQAKLPCEFWAEAVNTAVYLRNRSPTASLDGKTPYEAWTGEKPDLSHLRVIGCKVYSLIPEAKRSSKLHAKAICGILLGYGETTKGYRVFNPVKNDVELVREVNFSEGEIPGIKPEKVENTEDIFNVELPNIKGESQKPSRKLSHQYGKTLYKLPVKTTSHDTQTMHDDVVVQVETDITPGVTPQWTRQQTYPPTADTPQPASYLPPTPINERLRNPRHIIQPSEGQQGRTRSTSRRILKFDRKSNLSPEPIIKSQYHTDKRSIYAENERDICNICGDNQVFVCRQEPIPRSTRMEQRSESLAIKSSRPAQHVIKRPLTTVNSKKPGKSRVKIQHANEYSNSQERGRQVRDSLLERAKSGAQMKAQPNGSLHLQRSSDHETLDSRYQLSFESHRGLTPERISLPLGRNTYEISAGSEQMGENGDRKYTSDLAKSRHAAFKAETSEMLFPASDDDVEKYLCTADEFDEYIRKTYQTVETCQEPSETDSTSVLDDSEAETAD